ncbi:hypothetical protein [Paraurantiacibacter namhicola]|uniref:Uncharacterized protein n=1 Tax=Paraurantiacibacter namhicola TaxID=645517 RepID=A0A1C7D9B0_9SPHN|nr:hypothetical protein [Paraurantiacibacter namhicola]ANU07893.1 hypothetical protein A6F65_01594 [Paraurantiacibacter namhicola]
MPIIEPFLLIWAGILCVATALIHSIMGERQLIGPMLAGAQGVLENDQARQVTRFAWHWTTLLWFLVAAMLVLAGLEGVGNRWMIAAIGAAHLGAGFYDAIVTRGRHVGWPLLVLIGALVLTSLYLTQ